jgi:LacI family transcriptional regulator
MSVVGFDDIAAASWVTPGLTTIAQQKAEMGRLAVERLASATGIALVPEVIRLPTTLRARESSGPVRAAMSVVAVG